MTEDEVARVQIKELKEAIHNHVASYRDERAWYRKQISAIHVAINEVKDTVTKAKISWNEVFFNSTRKYLSLALVISWGIIVWFIEKTYDFILPLGH